MSALFLELARIVLFLSSSPITIEDDLLDGGPPVCHQLGHVSVLQYFGGTAGSMDHQHVFRQAGLS